MPLSATVVRCSLELPLDLPIYRYYGQNGSANLCFRFTQRHTHSIHRRSNSQAHLGTNNDIVIYYIRPATENQKPKARPRGWRDCSRQLYQCPIRSNVIISMSVDSQVICIVPYFKLLQQPNICTCLQNNKKWINFVVQQSHCRALSRKP